MSAADRIVQRQLAVYGTTHQNRTNLYAHLIAVPLFMVGTLGALYGLLMRSALLLMGAMLACLVSLLMQKRGHERELIQPEPFANAWEFLYRIVAEQWITFPRFVVSGGWLKNVLQDHEQGGCDRLPVEHDTSEIE